MKIAILGGSFDPPHLGHYLIAMQVKEILQMDQVWLMPLYQKNFQDEVFHKSLTNEQHRLAMAKLLENDFIKTSDFEITQNQKSFTIDTLKGLQKLHPQDTFYWIMGSDQLAGFHKYYQSQKLINEHHIIIFPREHMLWDLENRVKKALQLQTIPENVMVLQNKNLVLTNVSSTVIRERIKQGLSIHYLIPEEIETYIKDQNLYS